MSKLRSSILVASIAILLTACTKDDALSDLTFADSTTTAAFNSNTGFTNPFLDPNLNPPKRIALNPNIGPGPNPSGPASGMSNDVALQWTELLLELERYAVGMRPNASARALAYIHLATYETVLPGMPNYKSTQKRLQGFNIKNVKRPKKIDWQIALNAAYADVLDHFLINVTDNRKAAIPILEEQINTALANNRPPNIIAKSIKWGELVAKEVIKYSQTDQEAEQQILEPQPLSYEPPVGDGYWTYSADAERALYPYWESVRTFIISPGETTTLPPIGYSEDVNSEYFGQMMEVYEVNNTAKEEDNEDLWIAEFWSDDVEGLMMSPRAR